MRETHPARRQSVDVRGLVRVATIATQFGEAEVIGQDVDDIRLTGRSCLGLSEEGTNDQG